MNPSPDPKRENARILIQMERILDTKHFRQAKSLEKFLRFVVTQKLAGAENELKEYTIGLEVFNRGEDYDPRKDAVVRVQANVLRKRLTSYYLEEGLVDDLVIELPKGHYVPEFYPRSQCRGANESLSRAVAPEIAPQVRWKTPLLVTATFIFGLFTAFSLQHWFGRSTLAEKESGKPDQTINPAYLPLWEKFLEPGAENVLAYGTPQFFVANGVYLRDVEINSPQDAGPGSRISSLEKVMDRPFIPAEIYTGVGETHGVYLLTKFFGKTAKDLRVTRSRMVGWNEMKDANVIFLSSMRFHTLAKELPYQSDFVIDPGIASKVINLKPREGEQSTYGRPGNGDYAVITIWPGKHDQRRVVSLNGATTWATLAAAEYVTDPEYLRQLNQHLASCRAKTGLSEHPPYFQILLRAEIKDNQPVSISYVTHHDLEIGAPNSDSSKTINLARLKLPQRR